MKILVAPDKFKGSLTASEVCNAVAEFFQTWPEVHVTKLPLADGGEGTFQILIETFAATTLAVEVHDPLFRKIKANYGISKDGTTAFIEMAKASGLQLLAQHERNPLHTTTFGTGELIKDALQKGVSEIILGIGGSATNDAGVGMATALGYGFRDRSGKIVNALSGKDLRNIEKLDTAGIDPLLEKVHVTTLCDVNNPLTGTNGAAHMYGEQKGASTEDIVELDKGLVHFSRILRNQFNFSTAFAGAGAAGGLGVGAKFFLRAEIVRGFDYLARITKLNEKVENADLIITGEGAVDDQSLSGKVVSNVAQLAKANNKKVIVICGKVMLSPEQISNLAVDEILELSSGVSPEKSMESAYDLIKLKLKDSKTINFQ